MLGEETLEAITPEAVAARTGVSKALVFHYFTTRTDFQIEVVRAASAEIVTQMTAGRTQPESGNAIRAGLDIYLDYVVRNRTAYVALLRGNSLGDSEIRHIIERTRAGLATQVQLLAAEVGDLPDSPETTLSTRGLMAYVEEMALSWLEHAQIEREQWLDSVERTVRLVAADIIARQ